MAYQPHARARGLLVGGARVPAFRGRDSMPDRGSGRWRADSPGRSSWCLQTLTDG